MVPRFRDKRRGQMRLSIINIRNYGEMAEWSNAAVLKTVVPSNRDRGFESLFLRKARKTVQSTVFLFYTRDEIELAQMRTSA